MELYTFLTGVDNAAVPKPDVRSPEEDGLKITGFISHSSNVSGIIFICLLVWRLFISYFVLFFFSCNHKIKETC